MSSIWCVFLLSLLPGLGNFAGGMAAEFLKASPRLLNWSLHAACGIVLAIVAVELIPEALGRLAGWWIAAALAAGGITYILLEMTTQLFLAPPQEGKQGGDTMCMIYIAVAIDLASDGLMIGTGSAVSPALAVALAARQVFADVPEGYATVANFRTKGMPRRRRLMLSASFLLYVVGTAVLAHFLLSNMPDSVKLATLVFVSGLLTVAAVEDMLEEAHEAKEDNRLSVIAFVGGFALFTLISAGLDTIAGKSS